MKDDIKNVRAVASRLGMTKEERDEFRSYIHESKSRGHFGSGPRGDFTFQELLDLGQEFLTSLRPDDHKQD
jgi:hypothetical protein